MSTKRLAALALGAVVAACGGAYLTAPPGSTILVIASPPLIAAHGGVSELTAIVTESMGTEVADGTVVLWSTDIGRVDRETRTTRGIARNRLVSDSRSGIATVVAISGGGTVPGPAPSASPSGPPTPVTTLPSGGGVNAGTATVTIGNTNVARLFIRAQPQRITISNSTHVIATVLDAQGDPVPNVPVYFRVRINPDLDFFQFSGPIHTDNNGEADAVLLTRRTVPGTIQVEAEAPGASGLVPSPRLDILFL